MPLRDGENHQIQMRAGVEFRRADEIADVLQNDQVEPRRRFIEANAQYAKLDV